MINKISENYIINMNDFRTSMEFSNHLYDFLSKFASNKSITYPDVVYVDLNNGIHNISFLFVYPYLNKDISYEVFFKGDIIHNMNRLYIRISYTR